MDALYTLSPRAIWAQIKKEHFSFWMICVYLILEYFRPQSIIPALDVLPWDKIFVSLTALGLLADPRRRWVSNQANLWMTVFLLVIVLSSATAQYPAVSWSHWFDFFGWFAIYFLIINTVTTAERYFIFLSIFLLASFKLSFFGARTWVSRGFGFRGWGIQGPPGFFENSGELSIQMLMFAPIAFELAMFLKPRVRRAVYWVLILLPVTGAMTVLGASSRGSQLGLVFQTGYTAHKRKLNFKAIAAIALVFYGAYALLPVQEKERFTTAGDDRTSVQRLEYWRAGMKMIEEHPVLGIGYFNFPPYFAEHYPWELFEGHAQLPHNIFIQVGTDAGLLGLGVFLILIYRNLRTARDIQCACEANPDAPAFAGNVARGLMVATWGFVIAGQFVTVTYYPFLWINLALTVSLHNIVRRSSVPAATVIGAASEQGDRQRAPARPRLRGKVRHKPLPLRSPRRG